MYKHLLKLILIILFISCNNPKPLVSLNQNWEILEKPFVPSMDLTPITNPKDQTWNKIQNDFRFKSKDPKEYFLIRIPIPKNSLLRPAVQVMQNVAAISVYANSKLIYKSNDSSIFEPGKFTGWITHVFNIPNGIDDFIYISIYTETNDILLPPVLDEYENLIRIIIQRNLFSVGIIAIAVTFGITFLLSLLGRKFDRLSFSVGAFFICISIWLFCVNPLSHLIIPLTPFRVYFEYCSLYLAPAAVLLFSTSIFRSRLNPYMVAYALMFLCYAVITWLLDLFRIFPLWKTLIPFHILLILGVILFIVQLIRYTLKNNQEARILIVGMTILTLTAIHDMLNVLGFIDDSMLMAYGTFSFFLSMAAVALYRIKGLHTNLQKFSKELQKKNKSLIDLNKNLEGKVYTRTKEVTEKMKLINDLNIQQTGDYFLTSLIQQPLAKNGNTSDLVKTNFIIKQKKSFEFNKRDSDLGGDICITYTLKFPESNSKYVFFFNGDAMGKSMQGAGGAIVAGTVINSILAGFYTSINSLQSPRDWLYYTCKEIDKSFQTFDGSMLLSGVIGLINETTGELWYANSEHPRTVLFRDEKASFLDSDDESFFKFGSGVVIDYIIQRFELKAGDTLICGSDGRDDLDVSELGSERKINYDEKLFLKIVEYSRGDLDTILSNVLNAGKITDDLSLLQIQFQTSSISKFS
ncbi:MAG: SpoIIE family protein phosphatase [Leptospiraceae bacterium]|nr:SpoIIE family protein phosphatase [Leptospiraceae bacterium]